MRIFCIAIIFISFHITSVEGAIMQHNNNFYSMPEIDITSYEIIDAKNSTRQSIIDKIYKEWQNEQSLLIKLIVHNNYPLEKAMKLRKQLISSGINP